MRKFCSNPNCQNPGYKVVGVSVMEAFDGKMTLCQACHAAFIWGVDHGLMVATRDVSDIAAWEAARRKRSK